MPLTGFAEGMADNAGNQRERMINAAAKQDPAIKNALLESQRLNQAATAAAIRAQSTGDWSEHERFLTMASASRENLEEMVETFYSR